jgi:hypothetical protein
LFGGVEHGLSPLIMSNTRGAREVYEFGEQTTV